MSKNLVRKPIEIKISTVVAVSAILRELDMNVLKSALQDMTGGAPDYFDNEFTIIDFADVDLAGQSIDWPALIALFKAYSLNVIAVRNAPSSMESDILAHGLGIDSVPPSRPVPQPEEPQAPASRPAPAAPAQPALQSAAASTRSTMIIDTPVRAGQRIYAQGCDLVVTAAVNNGAEIIADGSIHVYAPLRGRALAGASGNDGARIFAMSMEAELLSIAGIYRTFENGLPDNIAQRPAQVRLTGDRLDLLSMSAAVRS
ncbi:septum site-determining protein MinC [Oxalobacteraceae bacterium R-40]|uniref:Probable septum site-determining protein MinC n=1 Tax=Keguizhuia sedimenti TaxID=3064264 RepID=A0ABU1BR15_9BURK|nr:septum site-determining protein MinC [Oxalobacteraceae bacterium R-40]